MYIYVYIYMPLCFGEEYVHKVAVQSANKCKNLCLLSNSVYSTEYEVKEKKSGRMLLISLSYPSSNLSWKGLAWPAGFSTVRRCLREILSLCTKVWSFCVASYKEHGVGRTPADLGWRLSHPGTVAARDRRCWPECSREKKHEHSSFFPEHWLHTF